MRRESEKVTTIIWTNFFSEQEKGKSVILRGNSLFSSEEKCNDILF